MRKIVLLCAQGMSTGVMVRRMREAAESQGYECDINAYAISQAKDRAADADVILLGPQVRFEANSIKKACPNVPVEFIDMAAYGRLDGKAAVEQAKKILND